MLSKARLIVKEFQVENQVTMSREVKSTVRKTRDCPSESISYSDCLCVTFTSRVPEQKKRKIAEKFSLEQTKTQFVSHSQLGELFADYGHFNNLCADEETMLTHKPGEVLCLNFCLLSDEASIQSVDFNQKVLQKHPHWKGRVRMIVLFLQSQKQNIKKKIEERQWHHLVHLFCPHQSYFSLNRHFRIWNSSQMVLVDKFGKIDFMGNSAQIDLQKKIDKLIQQQTQNEKPLNVEYQSVSEKEALKYIENLSTERVENHFKGVELFCFQLSANINYTYGQASIRGIINATVISDDSIALKTAGTFFGKHPEFDLKIKTVDYITIPSTKDAKCWQCNQHLEYPFYWLRWEEGIKFGCRKCVEETTTIQGHHFRYENNSVLLTGEWKKLAVQNLGTNIQCIHPKHLQKKQFYICCRGQSTKKAKYICQGCRMSPYFNSFRHFCDDCLQQAIKGETSMFKKMKSQGHQSNHPLLRILSTSNRGPQSF